MEGFENTLFQSMPLVGSTDYKPLVDQIKEIFFQSDSETQIQLLKETTISSEVFPDTNLKYGDLEVNGVTES